MRERERVDAIALEDTATAQSAQNRGVRMKQSSDNQPNPNPRNLPPSNPQSGDTQQQQKPMYSNAVNKPDVTAPKKAPPKRGSGSGATRRKRTRNDEDEEYSPARPRPSRARQPKTTQKTPGPRKAQEKASNGARGVGDPQSTPMSQSRQTQTQGEGRMRTSGVGLASTRTSQLPSDPTRTRPLRAAVTRKPIGPLLDAIRANK